MCHAGGCNENRPVFVRKLGWLLPCQCRSDWRVDFIQPFHANFTSLHLIGQHNGNIVPMSLMVSLSIASNIRSGHIFRMQWPS